MTTDADANAPIDYPQLFRRMIVRSTEAALAAIDPQAPKLEEEERERSLYALGLGLDLPEAWPLAQLLLMTIAQHMEAQGDRDTWADYIKMAIRRAELLSDASALSKLYLMLGGLYEVLDDYEVAQRYLLQGYQLAIQSKDLPIQLLALEKLSSTAANRTDFPQARRYINDAFSLLDVDDPLRARSYSKLGHIAMRQANWDDAIEKYTQALNLLKANNEIRFTGQAERNLGFALLYAKRYNEAIEHYQNSLQLLSFIDSPLDWAKTQMELGVAYWYLGDHQEALKLFELCEPIFVKTKSQVSLAHLYNNRGLALREIGEFDQALEAFNASIALMRELDHPLWIANAMESLGGMYQKMGRSEEAVATWEQALQELSVLPETPRYLHDLLVRRIREASGVQGEPDARFP